MPELPEMEHYKDILSTRIIGKPITHVIIEREKSINEKASVFVNKVMGQSIVSIERRAKFLAFHLSGGDRLLLHLMLGGKLFYGTEEESPDHTKQITLVLGEHALFFIGLRLGFLHVLTKEQLRAEWEKLGPEPLSPIFTEEVFQENLRRKRGRLKAVLVDQTFIAGIGNRYSDEILFEAALHPAREVHSLEFDDITRLYIALRKVLSKAIQRGGYLNLPIYKGDTQTGGAEAYMKVHGRAGEPCPRCGITIVEEKITSKKTFFCPNCQQIV